jgi:hypothetical protein
VALEHQCRGGEPSPQAIDLDFVAGTLRRD